jgi:predicted N-acetyltransferase YhbS
MVATEVRHLGLGRRLVVAAAEGARSAGCEWLHVDFEERLRPFYLDACGFTRAQPASCGCVARRERLD